MLHDAALPPGFPAPPTSVEERAGVAWPAARWTPPQLAALVARLEAGGEALTALDDDELLEAWEGAIAELRDPCSPLRRDADPALARLAGLSPAGFAAGLETLLAGMGPPWAAEVMARAAGRRGGPLAGVVLAATPPGLIAQALLPALALRRPVLVKSSRREPLLAPLVVRALAARAPALAGAVAAVTWPGGEVALEQAAFGRAGAVIAYGGAEAMAALRSRLGDRLLEHGPKMSVAVIGRGADPDETAESLSRDVALFDQGGCLALQAVLVAGDPLVLGAALAAALARRAEGWPPGTISPAAAARVQQLRADARLRGLPLWGGGIAEGTVVVETGAVEPSPGLRTVRLHRLERPGDAAVALWRWRGSLQGAALAGEGAAEAEAALRPLGVNRFTPPGRLQATEATWDNGGRDLVAALAAHSLAGGTGPAAGYRP